MFSLDKKIIAITGCGGVLGSAIARGLVSMGATIVALDRSTDKAQNFIDTLPGDGHRVVYCDVLDEEVVSQSLDTVFGDMGRIDVLINAAGGNQPGATIGPDQSFGDIKPDHLNKVFQLNVMGTMIPSSIVSKKMIEQGFGNIINISSMAAKTPLTRVMGYSASKAAIDNFTKWLAVEMATKYGENFRVNAIAPGFFIGAQNKSLLLDKDDKLTARGRTIVEHTPMRRFGEPEELVGTAVWLCSDASKFVTGTIVSVDGGFSAFSGV